jgi:putative hydrolase of the HAD superfamily
MEIRALLFDVNSTLIDIETDERMDEIYRAIARFLSYQGIFLHRGELCELYFQVMKEQFRGSLEKYPEFNVVAVWQEILARNATAHTRSLSPQKLQQLPLLIAEMQRGISRKRLLPFPQVEEVLRRLKERYRLAVVTDAQSAYALPELRAVGLHEYFDPIVISGDYGYRKPDPRLFQAALDRLQVTPDQAIFVGDDRYRDVFGARQLGMKTVWLCNQRVGSHPGDAEPDYIIYGFGELENALDFFAGRQTASSPGSR